MDAPRIAWKAAVLKLADRQVPVGICGDIDDGERLKDSQEWSLTGTGIAEWPLPWDRVL